ncbi:MAG: putative adenine deaminase YerA [Syntrophorhabdus sp. PtaB.Bin047]|nr:MAG: putative adenine deaminase YerA [Syntrophorhabdus sp. PtaB.Bin047]
MVKRPSAQHMSSHDEAAHLFLRGGTILNVYSGELLKGNIAVRGERIVYVGPSEHHMGRDTNVLDLAGRTIAPGYIEPHFHPWDVYNPVSVGEEACRRGTTTVFCDDLVFYMEMGPRLFQEFMDAFSDMPIKYYWSLRTAPQSPMRDEKRVFSVENLLAVLENPRVQSIGEITRWMELIKGTSGIPPVIARTKELKKRVDGHTAGARYDKLNRLALAGIESCHESINGQNVLDRLRLGFYVMLRESSLRQDLSLLLKTVARERVLTDRLLLTTDGSMPEYYDRQGVTDHLIRIALREGIDPVSAYRMVTINPAVYFGLDHRIGGIAPGRDADMVVLRDIREPTPETVISRGRIVAKEGGLVGPFPPVDWERYFPKTSFSKRDWRAREELFRVSVPPGVSTPFPVIELANPAITRIKWVDLPSRDGYLDFDASRYLMVAMIGRDGDWITTGLLEGFGDGIEALASSYNTAAQILVVGRNARAMSAAVNRILDMKGGIVIFDGDGPCFELALPIGGVMSEKALPELAGKERELQSILFSKGYPYHDPMYTLVFLPNDFLPEVRVNYRGILDVKNNRVLWPRTDLI